MAKRHDVETHGGKGIHPECVPSQSSVDEFPCAEVGLEVKEIVTVQLD